MIDRLLRILPVWAKSRFRGRLRYQAFFERLYNLALVGMNHDEGFLLGISGEIELLKRLQGTIKGRDTHPFVILDVGANVGDYTRACLDVFGMDCLIYAFEPSRTTFEALARTMNGRQNVNLRRIALSDTNGNATLYSDWQGSPVASLYDDRLKECCAEANHIQEVETQRLDDFCRVGGIGRIDLLKMDVEGHELSVLKGATDLIASGAIRGIQFEFSNCNIASRTYFRDFYDLLAPSYQIFRIVKDGLYPIRHNYGYEIFRTVNYYAERKT